MCVSECARNDGHEACTYAVELEDDRTENRIRLASAEEKVEDEEVIENMKGRSERK